MPIQAKIPLRRIDSPERPVFTGERFVPGLGGIRIAYEHLHRYAFARRFVSGRRVLDLGCGLGYGAEVLAPLAREVVSLDRDLQTVRQAGATRTHALGPFLVADAGRLPFRAAAFDVVIAFELIEHVTEQEMLLAEVRRVLGAEGLFLVSSPDTLVYSGKLGERNPFHPKEMTTDELRSLVARHFARVVAYKQRVITGSLLLAGEPPPEKGAELFVTTLEAEPPALVVNPSDADFVYNVMVCGPAGAPDLAPRSSVLADVESLAISAGDRAHYREVWDALAAGGEDSAKLNACGSTDERELASSAELTKRILVETVGVGPDDTILEIGAGVGRVGEVLAPLCREWIGADVSRHMLEHAHRRLAHLGNVRLVLLNGYDLAPIASASVDLVFGTLLFMHLAEWERFAYVREALRVLRPGGRMLVDGFNLLSDDGWALFERMTHFHPHERPPQISTTSTPQEVEAYFVRAGFADVQQQARGMWLITYGRKPDGLT